MLAEVFSLRGTCPRAKVGAVIVKQGHVIAHGYNGAPNHLPHCDDTIGCSDVPGQGCNTAVHAEENAIAYAARVGVECATSTLYCTHEPCLRCARLIVQAGIESVVFSTPYRDHTGTELLGYAGVAWSWHYVDMDAFRA